MANQNQTNSSNQDNKSESEIQQSLEALLDLLSEFTFLEENSSSSHQTKTKQKNGLVKQQNYPSPAVDIPSEIKQEKQDECVDGDKSQNYNLGKETNLNSALSKSIPSIKSVSNGSLVHRSTSNYPTSESFVFLQQSVKNLEKKLKDNQNQLDEVMDSINSLLSLTVELINLQPNASPQSIIKIIVPVIDRIIEERSTQDLKRMGAVLANVLPVAITQKIEATPKSIAQALAPEIALSIQEQIRLDKESISRSIGPEMGKAIKAQIELERDAMVDALYPVIGSTIAKYMGEVIQTINEKVENTLSIEGVKRKIRAKIQGVSEAELILQEAIPYEIQAIFLIHKASGLVMHELQPNSARQLEADLMAGMLTAIRSFANDLIAQSSELDEIDYDDCKIILEAAGYCYLAVVVKGEPSKQFRQKIRAALSELVLKHGTVIEVYNGDSSTVPESIKLFLEQLLEQDIKQNSSGRPTTLLWLIAILLGMIVVPWGITKYKNHVASRIMQQAAVELDAAPELSVYRLLPKVERGKLILTGRVPSEYLRNQAEETVTEIAEEKQLVLENQIIAVDVPPDPTITSKEVEMITSVLNQQEGVAILSKYQEYTVTVRGFVLNQLDESAIAQNFQQIPGVEKIIISLERQLPVVELKIYFASGSIALDSADFTDNIIKVKQWLAMYPQLHLRIIGHSDRSGSRQYNQKLAQDRARKVETALVAQGIKPERLQVLGSIERPPGVTANQPLQESRCVRFEFFIPSNSKNAKNN